MNKNALLVIWTAGTGILVTSAGTIFAPTNPKPFSIIGCGLVVLSLIFATAFTFKETFKG